MPKTSINDAGTRYNWNLIDPGPPPIRAYEPQNYDDEFGSAYDVDIGTYVERPFAGPGGGESPTTFYEFVNFRPPSDTIKCTKVRLKCVATESSPTAQARVMQIGSWAADKYKKSLGLDTVLASAQNVPYDPQPQWLEFEVDADLEDVGLQVFSDASAGAVSVRLYEVEYITSKGSLLVVV